jgi:Acetyltransferase (GNAT) domain
VSAPPAIVSLEQDHATFEAIQGSAAFTQIEAHPQTGAYARLYYPAVHGEACRDVSFAVLVDGKPAAVALCTVLSGKLWLYGLPLRVFYAAEADEAVRARATPFAMAEIDRLARTHAVSEVIVRDVAGPALSSVGEACLSRDAHADVKVVAEIDLTLGEGGWRKALRKSFRSLLNWGRREMRIETGADSADLGRDFARFREFHRHVAGRVTRPIQSWSAMQSWVADGRGELYLGSLQDRLVAATLIIDGTKTAIYMTGVYDRELFGKPLAHYPLWLAFEDARRRGMKRMELGDVHIPGTVSEKEYAIGYFKRGFATALTTHLQWTWQPKQRE